jgi:multiple sugar transport system permease protein
MAQDTASSAGAAEPHAEMTLTGSNAGRPHTGPGVPRRGPVNRAFYRLHRPFTAWLFLVPAVAFIIIFFGYPLVYNVEMSLENYTIGSFVSGVSPFVGLDNYRTVIQDPVFAMAVFNTVVFTIGCIVAEFSIGLGLAVFFNHRFPLNTALRSLLMLPWLVPIIVSGTTFRWIFGLDYGVLNQTLLHLHLIAEPIPWLTNRWFALVSVMIITVWIGIPFNCVILYSGLQGIPPSLYEAAHVDGAGAIRCFWSITLPLLRPVSSVVLTLNVIYALKVFDAIWITTQGGPANATLTLSVFAYSRSFHDFLFGQGAAIGTMLMIVAGVFAIIYAWTSHARDAAA